MKRKIIITAVASGIIFFTLGACVFSKNSEMASPIQLLQLLAQATNCWISSGSTATTACSIGIGGATPDANTKLAVNGRISSSVLGVYCGQTASTAGSLGGWTTAKSLCQTACGSANAHMCSGHEIMISRQIGVGPAAWAHWYGGHAAASPGAGEQNTDCGGWTSAASTVWGSRVLGNDPDYARCNTSLPLACCL